MVKDLCFEILQTCPNNCRFCSSCAGMDKETMVSFETFKKVIDYFMNIGGIEEISISGGEPFAQKKELLELVKAIKNINKNIVIYTGYIYEELLKKNDDTINEILNSIDYLVDGPFVLSKRDLTLTFRGSQNQRFIDVKKTILENKIITLYN